MPKQISAYLLLMAAGPGFLFLKQLVLGRLLEKGEFGLFAYYTSIVAYALPLVNLGILESLSRSFPILLGRDQESRAIDLRNQSLGLIFGITSTLLAAGATLLLLLAERFAFDASPQVIVLVCTETLLTTFFFVALREVRARKKPVLYAQLLLLRGVFDCGLSLLLAKSYGLVGVLAGENLTLLAITAYLFWGYIESPLLRIPSRETVRELFGDGLKILAYQSVAGAALFGDRILLGLLIGKDRFADYAFHMLAFNVMAVFSNFINQYLHPVVLTEFGATGDLRTRLAVLSRWTGRFLLSAIPACALVSLLWIPAVEALFPKFQPNYWLILCILAGSCFQVANLYPIPLIALQAYRGLVVSQIGVALLVGAGILTAWRLDAPLAAYGAVFLMGRFLSWGSNRWIAEHASAPGLQTAEV